MTPTTQSVNCSILCVRQISLEKTKKDWKLREGKENCEIFLLSTFCPVMCDAFIIYIQLQIINSRSDEDKQNRLTWNGSNFRLLKKESWIWNSNRWKFDRNKNFLSYCWQQSSLNLHNSDQFRRNFMLSSAVSRNEYRWITSVEFFLLEMNNSMSKHESSRDSADELARNNKIFRRFYFSFRFPLRPLRLLGGIFAFFVSNLRFTRSSFMSFFRLNQYQSISASLFTA